jgi:hypothetical protein
MERLSLRSGSLRTRRDEPDSSNMGGEIEEQQQQEEAPPDDPTDMAVTACMQMADSFARKHWVLVGLGLIVIVLQVTVLVLLAEGEVVDSGVVASKIAKRVGKAMINFIKSQKEEIVRAGELAVSDVQ